MAELFPVEIPRRGFRITLTLPFIVGIAHTGHLALAVLVNVFVAFLAGVTLMRWRRKKVNWRSVTLHTSLAALACGMGALAYWLCHRTLPESWVRSLIDEVLFVAVYATLHYALIWALGRQHESVQGEDSAPRGVIGIFSLSALFLMTSLGVLVLIDHGVMWALPLLMVPLLTIRQAFIMSNQLDETYSEAIITLTLMLQRTHPYSHGHLGRVAHMAEKTALRLGLSSQRAMMLRHAALLHDIGKIAIDEEILDKPAKLTDAEMEHVRKHAEFGAKILRQNAQFRGIADWILHHHERPDGNGYPNRLRDVEIPIESKIIAVTDAFDAMVGGTLPHEKRPYREPLTQEQGLLELKRCAGTQFDPKVVSAFSEVVLEAAT